VLLVLLVASGSAQRIFFEPLVKIYDVSLYNTTGTDYLFRSGSVNGGA